MYWSSSVDYIIFFRHIFAKMQNRLTGCTRLPASNNNSHYYYYYYYYYYFYCQTMLKLYIFNI